MARRPPLCGHAGPSTVAKCYRLLQAMLTTAVEDDVLVKNPCVIRAAGVERAAERPTQQRFLRSTRWPIVRSPVPGDGDAGDVRSTSFRRLADLTRDRVDLLHAKVTVTEQVQELANGQRTASPPKTAAGRRTVALPPHVLPELEAHLSSFAEPGERGLVFPAPEGGPLRRSNFRRRVWVPARRAAGIEGLRFHDLRHTRNTLAAATGASTRELMARMGHASPRAALIYQHATADRDAAIARALSDLVAGKGNPFGRVVPLRATDSR